MRKTTLLTLALSVSALFASAQSLKTFTAGKVYSIKNKKQTDPNGRFYYAAAMPQTSDMACTAEDKLDLSCLFTITPVEGETNVYTIKPYADDTKVVYAIKVANDNNTVGIKENDNAADTKWKIAEVTGATGYVSIISASATAEQTGAYWNARGSNADWGLRGIGGFQAASANGGSHWTIAEVSDADIATAKTNLANIYSTISTDQIKEQVGYYSRSLIDEVKNNITNAADDKAAYKAVKSFGQLINLPVDGKVYNLYALYSDGNKNYPGGAEGKWVAQKLENNTYKFVNTTADKDGLINKWGDATSYVVSTQERKKFGALTLNNGQYLCVDKNGVVDRLTGGDNNTSHGFSTDFMFEEVSSTNYAGHAVNFTESTDGKAYATLNLPFATTIPTGVTAYKKVDGTESSVKLDVYKNADEVLPANTPVLLQADAAGKKTFAPAAYESKVETGFSGTLAAAVKDANAYILAKDGEAVKFCKLSATSNTVNANKAYFTLTAAAANALNFDFGGVTTGIENAVADKANNAPIYDLSGRRVMNAVKGGIYIQNGKKFVK